jgi:phosphate-selective porin OprO/OprP
VLGLAAPPAWSSELQSGTVDPRREQKPTEDKAETAEDEPQESPEKPEEEQEEDKGKQEDESKGPAWREHLYWADGLYLDSGWNNLKVRFGTAVQNDTAGYANTESAEELIGQPIENGVEWRRARAHAEGTFGTHFQFKFMYDFTAAEPPNLKDSYFGLRNLPIPSLEIIAGRFKAPLGLEGYTGSNSITFMERGLTNAFLPSRNTGLLFHGDLPRKRIRWAIGFLQPETDNIDLSNTDNLGLSGRFAGAFHPGGDGPLVHLGLDLWRRNVDTSIELASRPESNLAPNFVDTGNVPATGLNVGAIEVAVAEGPLSFQGEFVPTQVTGEDRDSLFFYAFYAMASYFLTGETRPYISGEGRFGRPHPKRELRDGTGGRGAFEVAARFSRIDLSDRGVEGGVLNDITGAFNWYPTYHTRVMSNVIWANLEGADPVWIFQMRLQIAF